MGRIFTVIAVVTFLMTAATGTSVYYFSQKWINDAKNEAFSSVATGAAQSISTRTLLLTQTLQNIVRSPELSAALRNSDLVRAKKIVQKMGEYLPGVMTFRLLLPTDTKIDTSVIPHLGYADLDLVKNTFKKPQPPLIQGEKGENRHLAITQGILQDDKVIAVILASVSFKELRYSFNKLANNRIYLELKQADFVLFSQGNSELKTSQNPNLINIEDTSWDIAYWSDKSINLAFFNLVLTTILIPAFISGLACYVSFRKLEAILVEDQKSILKATKDIMTDKPLGKYPVSLKEMSTFISNIIQFRRVLRGEDDQDNAESKLNIEGSLSDFLEESEDTNFLSEEYPGFDTDDAIKTEIGSLISLPDSGARSDPVITEPESPKSGISSAQNPTTLTNRQAPTDSIFRTYDIRGIVDQTLTKDIVYDIGRAIGSEIQDKGIGSLVLAQDARISSPALSKILADGILSTGTDILDIGIVPTPVLYFVAHHHESRSGVVLTGSHNPAEYNGLKIVIAGETLAENKILALKKRIDTNDFHASSKGTLTENSMFTNEYIGIITDDIRIARPMKVVVDAGNGVAGELGPTLLKTLGCEVIELFCDIDGSFPNHHPDPSNPENLADLISAVKHYQADVGIAFDGDGDRMGVVDSSGKIIWPDRQMMLFSKYILDKKPGADIIYDVKCSRHLASQIKKHGGRPVMWKTGHSLIKAQVKKTGAIFAGEMSGHLFFNDRWFGFDDGLYSAARLVEILSEESRTSAEVFADFPHSPCTPELYISLPEGENFSIINELLLNPDFPDGEITDIDGLRVDFSDGFGLVRASNTTPALVVRFEGDSEEALTKIQDQFRQLILQIKPKLSLPF